MSTEEQERTEGLSEPTDTDPAVELVIPFIDHFDPNTRSRCPTCREKAGSLIAALRRDGLALPPVVQTREEAGWMIGDLSIVPYVEMIQRQLTMGDRRFVRTISTLADDGSPHGGATLVGRWRNVDE